MPTEPVRIDDFAAYRYVNSVRVTPDAKRLVYSVISVDLQENRYDNDLWTLDLSSGDRRRLTGSGKEGRFDFMDDGSVLFVSRRGGQAADSKAGKAGNPATSNAAQDGARPSQAQVVALATERSAGELAGDPSRGTDLYRIALDGGEAELYAHIPLTVADWRQCPAAGCSCAVASCRIPPLPTPRSRTSPSGRTATPTRRVCAGASTWPTPPSSPAPSPERSPCAV